MRVEIIAAGAELTSGQRVDTNSAWLATALAELGLHCAFHTTVSDDMADNVAAIAAACQRADIIIMTGGLGPTQDDITRNALAGEAETAALIAEVDAAFEAWSRSTEQLLTVAQEVIALADSIEHDLGNAQAALEEWL